MTRKFAVTDVYCLDASKSVHPISTGIGYLDHMIDQLNSHAQVGVSVTVIVVGNDDDAGAAAADDAPALGGKHEGGGDDDRGRQRRHPSSEFVNRYANEDQSEILSLVGSALGERLGALLSADRSGVCAGGGGTVVGSGSRFRCPLDEALVECTLTTTTTTTTTNGKGKEEEGGGRLVDFTLPPYGIYPPDGIGRTKIGCLETRHVASFFDALARSSGLHISLVKVRGDNGHHVIESAYKAFSRAFRNLLDGTDAYYVGSYDPLGYEAAWYRGTTTTRATTGSSSSSSTTSRREGRVERSTKETSISVYVRLSGGGGLPEVVVEEEESPTAMTIRVDTGINTLDKFVSILAREADMCVDVACTGDLYVDDHHTSEDVSIALGQALDTALGTRAGLNRMWCAVGTYGDAEVEVTMDLSNRPHVIHDLFKSNSEEYAGDLSVEMLVHVLESLASNSKSTVHVVENKAGGDATDTFLATAVAYGRALRMCGAVDPRRAGLTASSKGTLSV